MLKNHAFIYETTLQKITYCNSLTNIFVFEAHFKRPAYSSVASIYDRF